MKLYYHPLSPFARKALVTALENGLGGRIETQIADTQDEALRTAHSCLAAWYDAAKARPSLAQTDSAAT